MATVSYFEDEIPPATEEEIAEMKTLAERPDSEIDLSEMPAWDKLDFKYAIPGVVFEALNSAEKRELSRKIRLAKEAERAALEAQEEAFAIAETRRQLAHQS